MHVHRYGSEEGENERIFPKLPYRMRLRIVCKPCNNNWMGQIEDNAKPWALPMIVGNGKSLHETGEHYLATWAVLKTLVTHYASPVSHDDWVVPASHYRELYESHEAPKPPAHTRVWIGAYRGDRHPATAMMRGLRLTRTDPDSGAAEANGYLAAFSVEGLVLVVFGHDASESIDFAFRKNLRPALRQIWPYEKPLIGGVAPFLTDNGLMAITRDIRT